jgi:WASH complex subunit strumpellin
LVNRLSSVLNEVLVFPSTNKKVAEMSTNELESILSTLAGKMHGFRRSFEYSQDYIGIYGLKMWQEEYGRIVNHSVERECNRFLKKKVLDSMSEYQSKTIPIPIYASTDKKSYNFVGRLTRALLVLTDSRTSIYSPECSGWYKASGEEIGGLSLFNLLNNSIGLAGLNGIDKLMSFRLVHTLRGLLDEFKIGVGTREKFLDGNGLDDTERDLYPTHGVPSSGMKAYSSPFMKKMSKLTTAMLDYILRIGQAQLIRRHIANELYFSCKLDSHLLCNALDNMNKSVLKDIREHYRNEANPYPETSNPVLPEISKYLGLIVSNFNVT